MKTLLENGDKVSDTALRVGAKRDAAADDLFDLSNPGRGPGWGPGTVRQGARQWLPLPHSALIQGPWIVAPS